ncbi:serine/threonine-protein kinase M1 [Ciborinia camelliae]|nr:serine/threonine-protein kinase M1 [Ciborinia camelliae]
MAPHEPPNGTPGRWEAPPSTMAAQLINNLSTKKPSRQIEHDDLQSLMTEVSSRENDPSDFTDPDAMLEHKHKLLYVISKVVLEKLNKDDPFMNVQNIIDQACEALDVFISTVKDVPNILNYVSTQDHPLKTRGPEPFWIWLFPRVLSCLGRRNCKKLNAKIEVFFSTSFEVVARSPKLWRLNSNFFSYLKDSVSTKVSIQAASFQDATPAFQDYLAWMFDSFHSSYELQKVWISPGMLNQDHEVPTIALFCSLHALLSSIQKSISESLIRKGYVYLALIGADIITTPSNVIDKDLNLIFCQALLDLANICRKDDSTCRTIRLSLLPKLQTVLDDEDASIMVGKDFQNASAALTWACRSTENTDLELVLPHMNFDTNSLNADLNLLVLKDTKSRSNQSAPPSKRRKIHSEESLLHEIIAKLYSLLSDQEVMDVDGLCHQAEKYFANLNDPDRCKVIDYLSMIPCAAYGSLTVTRDKFENITSSRCFICEKLPPPQTTSLDDDLCQKTGSEAILILTTLVKSPAFHESRRPRVLAMVAVKAFAIHFRDEEFFNLETSVIGQWCLKSLQSSVREMRIAAGRTLPEFLQGAKAPQDLVIKNRTNVLIILRDLSEKPTLYWQETCILAWGQLARVLIDGELNIVLLMLVDYLGHSNPIVSNVAYNEILKLANRNGTTERPVERLFSPFWDSVAIAAVKDLLSRPQTSQLMADLLEITVSEFLILTQAYTLPWLVLWRDGKTIKKIAQARNEESWRVCTDNANIVHIMALLLIQDVQNIENHTMSVLKCVSSDFEKRGLDFAFLLKMDPSSTFLHLLKVAGHAEDNSKKSRIRLALQFLVENVQSTDQNRKRNNPMAAFLEQHNLGLVTRISEIVNDNRDVQSSFEKKRNLKAIEEMVTIGKIYTRAARPQICACLQSALAQKELQASAFSAWTAMLRYLGDEDVEWMLESTFVIIIQHWESFDDLTQKAAEEILQYLFEKRPRLIRNKIVNLPSLSKFPQLIDIERKLNEIRRPTDVSNAFQIFSRRIRHETAGVVAQALSELKGLLQLQQSYLQASAVSEQPDAVVGKLVRSIMDACVKFNESHHDIAKLSGECIGLIGCLDPNRVEAVRDQREMVVLMNFHDPEETTDFVLFLLEEVIVKAFLSATDTTLQGFLSFVMQELLLKGGFADVCAPIMRGGEKDPDNLLYKKWESLPESVQATLTPFLTSMFSVLKMEVPITTYPIFRPDSTQPDRINKYNNWLKTFVLDLLQKPKNLNAELIFAPLCRAIRIKDLSVASFLLPYLILHVVAEGSDQERDNIGAELLGILKYESTSTSHIKQEELKLCSEAVFRVLDYLSRWIQAKQKAALKDARAGKITMAQEAGAQIQKVTRLVESIPAEIVSARAIQCKAYSRALFNWEQHIRHIRGKKDYSTKIPDLERLQEIYTQIDEPDGIEGISAHLHVLDIDQIVLGHRKAGRWTAAQGWYEIKLAEDPQDVDVQVNLLTCLKESGQHDVLLNYIEGMQTATKTIGKLLPFATEASWATGRWAALEKYTSIAGRESEEDFNVSIGKALLALHQKESKSFISTIEELREQITCSLSRATTSSIGSFHDPMLKLHVLTELEMIAGLDRIEPTPREELLESLDRRLETIGGYLNDKQYLLGIRRAAMQLSSLEFTKGDLASAWLTSARLARKGNAIHQSFNAVLHASQLGDESAKIEHARLLWKEEQHRKAIQSLQGAIESNAFISHNEINKASITSADDSQRKQQQNLLEARAHLLLAKWLDRAGQTNSSALRSQYQIAAKTHIAWEKGHYYLGRHYNKLLESSKNLPLERQDENYLCGETASLVISNYLRSLSHGTKYVYQTLPRILTLWLDLGTQLSQKIDSTLHSQEFVSKMTQLRKKTLADLHLRFRKYINKMPAYIFYTALPQIVSRITHPHNEVNNFLQQIMIKVVTLHPQQSLWSLLALSTSTQPDRQSKGIELLNKLTIGSKKIENSFIDIKALIRNGKSLTSEILKICEAGDFEEARTYRASLSKDLMFNQKFLPSLLACPVEAALTATLPTLPDKVSSHQAFSRDVITINAFEDDVLVLNSLAKPRRLNALASNGQHYGLLCKPKDDLRKDQRLMEFNGMINRSLKRDAESSRRQLYIRTYAVTPLNEKCGIIEWIEGLQTLRQILLDLYVPMGIKTNYKDLDLHCHEAMKGDKHLHHFTDHVLGGFPPVFHHWFVQQFPEPSTWFAARLRYTRSCAVMSIVGTILGLGDRHTENVLFEKGNGGTFHVDFNCIFEKGLTFNKPERVPFRLTHNMVDAMGMYGYEGAFRKSSELTLKVLRQHEETLMTILEAFIYDPTIDLFSKADEKRNLLHLHHEEERRKKRQEEKKPLPQAVLEVILRKFRGLLTGESVPLSVEGHVDELIKEATDPRNLTAMYIGWCSFY